MQAITIDVANKSGGILLKIADLPYAETKRPTLKFALALSGSG